MLHTDSLPANTPTVLIHYRKPRPNRIRVQGIVTPTDSTETDNVELWGNWVQAKKQYKKGHTIYHFDYTLEADPPGPKPCN